MQLVTRAQWGAHPSKYDLVYIASTKGVKVHYEGTPVPVSLVDHHDQCDDRMRAIQASHLANTREDYSDIAYNFVVCPHGYVYEGRGLHKKTAANGNQPLNIAHYAVCGMVGSEGYTHPTDAQLGGIRDAIEYLQREGGAGQEIKGHRDGYATECPGAPLYAWVVAGAPRPASTVPAKPVTPAKLPTVSVTHLIAAAHRDPGLPQGGTTHPDEVRRVEAALKAEGLLPAKYATDGSFGTVTIGAYARWQKAYSKAHGLGWTGAAVNGIPGRTSLAALGAKHGFNVTP